ncbi:MAG: S24 family peptidase [Humidesulfovibrio sp.]|nr:S24 family peptidase [Humidesulfovibrio sp.]
METTKFEERLQRLMQSAGSKSDSDLARALGILPQSVAAARKRQQIPGGWVEQIAEKFNASADWLLFGITDAQALTAAAVRGVTQLVGKDRTKVVPASRPEVIECMDCHLAMVPMVEARLAAGTGSFETGGDTERRYAFRTDFLSRKGQISQMVLMRVEGDSMEPKIESGDTVLIDQSQTQPRPGGMYAVGVEDLVYIKMIDTKPGKIILKSMNPAYEPMEIDARGDLADGIRILGRAIWIGREMR